MLRCRVHVAGLLLVPSLIVHSATLEAQQAQETEAGLATHGEAPASGPDRALDAPKVAEWEPPPAREHPFPLTIREIMRGHELVGQAPEQVRWTDDARWLYFRWLPGGAEWHEERDLYRVPAAGGPPERIDEALADSLEVLFANGDLSRDRRLRVSAIRGDLYLVDRRTMAVRRLTHTLEEATAPTFSRDADRVFFRRGNDLFALRLSDGAVRQLTDIREGPEPEEEKAPEGHKAFLTEQQEELYDWVRVEKLREEREEARRERREAERPETLWMRQGERVESITPDPDGRRAVVVFRKPAEEARQVAVPDWVTASGYTEELTTRPKVGDAQDDLRAAMLDLETGERSWLDLRTGETRREVPEEAEPEEHPAPDEVEGELDPEEVQRMGEEEAVEEAERLEDEEREDRREAARRNGARPPAAAPRQDAPEEEDERPADEPELALVRVAGWNDAGTHALLFAVDFDYRSWRLWALEADADEGAGELTLLDELHDEAWVGGPCFPFCNGWLPDSDRAWYASEETGWAHLYTIRADGSDRRQLTEGEWEVHAAHVTEARSGFLVHTSEVSRFDLHPYRMAFDGSNRSRLAEGNGRFEATASPDGRRLALLHSRPNRPPELFVGANRPGLGHANEPGVRTAMNSVTASPTEEWRAFPWIEPEIVHLTAADGVDVPARIYRPADLGAEPNGAAVIFVHGAGYLQNVHNWWSSYFREYMFHHFLAASGYTVLDIDFRGSAGHGRDWRTAVYRHMGGNDLSDQVDGARHLVEHEGVDSERIGIYGGSYGGFITLMAMFTEPETFAAGAALRSVTDWAHYNHWYTSRILNLPHEDEEAYRRSSPIYFAEGLEGDLLILHGMVDVNVHFSDVVRLAQRLIELGKERWEMAVYPVEDHAFVTPAGWTDEYRRIFELFERSIAAERPAAPPARANSDRGAEEAGSARAGPAEGQPTGPGGARP